MSASASATAPAASITQDPAIGPDSYTGYLVSNFQGSTETTFYVLAVYYGAVQVRRIRHTLAASRRSQVIDPQRIGTPHSDDLCRADTETS